MKCGLDQNNGSSKIQKLDPFELIVNNDITELEHYIKRVHINQSYLKKGYIFYTLLSYACKNGHIVIVKLLLEHPDIDVNLCTPLYCACSNGHIDIVQLLLEHPNINLNYCVPLVEAFYSGHIEIVKLLLKQKDIDVNKGGALAAACKNGHIGIVQLLLKQKNIDVNKDGPLLAACSNGYIDIVQLLLERKDIIITQNKHVYNILLRLKRHDLLKVFTNQQVKEYKQKWIQKFNKLK